MLHGDISNIPPARVLVHLDVITKEVEKEVPFLALFKRTRTERVFDTHTVSRLWRYSVQRGVSMDLFCSDLTQPELQALLDELDEQQTHPFRSATVYPDLAVLVSELAYRQDILGVVDLPERGLRYGSRWISLDLL